MPAKEPSGRFNRRLRKNDQVPASWVMTGLPMYSPDGGACGVHLEVLALGDVDRLSGSPERSGAGCPRSSASVDLVENRVTLGAVDEIAHALGHPAVAFVLVLQEEQRVVGGSARRAARVPRRRAPGRRSRGGCARSRLRGPSTGDAGRRARPPPSGSARSRRSAGRWGCGAGERRATRITRGPWAQYYRTGGENQGTGRIPS